MLYDQMLNAGLIGLALAGLTGIYFWATSQSTEQESINWVRTTQANIKKAFGNGGYSGLDQDFVIAADLVPAKMVVTDGSTSALVNPFGGDVTIQTENSGRYFSITFAEVPAQSCIRMLMETGDWGSGIREVKVDGTSVASQSTDFPITASSAATACSADVVSVGWTIR